MVGFLLGAALCAPTAAQAKRADRNHDRIPDRWERRYHLSLRVNQARRDQDHDRLVNRREYRLHTNPRKRDTDGDGIIDGLDRRPRVRDPAPGTAASESSGSAPGAPGSASIVPSGPARMRPPGSPVLDDVTAAAGVRRSPWEPRPGNATPNHTMATAAQVQNYYANGPTWGGCDSYRRRVTGHFTGTTDEIIEWAAWKWGIDEDVVRAEAVTESRWNQNFVNGEMIGLLQMRASGATASLVRDSTAFNLDYYGGTIRSYYDGCATWLGAGYAAGDLWGSVGAWYSGQWHRGADAYVANTQRFLAQRTWASPGF